MGIPEYRLPKEVLRAEIRAIESVGVEIQTNSSISPDGTLDRLLKQGYRAVFIATGAHRSIRLGVRGEETPGVVEALQFLREANLGEHPSVGGRVAVIGGGNVTVDAARVAVRQGAKSVSIIYRRPKADMPASDEELKQAEEEGIQLICSVVPIRILGADRVTALKCIRTEPGSLDESGRPYPIPIKGSEFKINVDTVITAVGQTADLSFVGNELQISPTNTLTVDPNSFTTSKIGVFAGGDVVTGPTTVAEAIGAGRRASISIDRYIRGKRPDRPLRKPPVARIEQLNLAYFQPIAGAQTTNLQFADRINGFDEVDRGFTNDLAIAEAKRCLSCGVCNGCDTCWLVCPEVAISNRDREYKVNLDYCKGCGLCEEECPRGVITMEQEAG